MEEHTAELSFRRRHKLMLQTVAFVGMMVAPAAMYAAAQSSATPWLLASLGALAASMAVAVWVS